LENKWQQKRSIRALQVEKAAMGSMRSDLDKVQQRVEKQGSEIQSIQEEQCRKEIKLIKSEMKYRPT
jgi:hypothetical protein